MNLCAAGHDIDVVGEYVYPNFRGCKACKREKSRAYSATPRGKTMRARRAERTRSLDRVRQMVRAYGVDQPTFEAMLDRQGGVCAICGAVEKTRSTVGNVRRISIDHDHETGVVRGLLCSPCNRALGLFRDDLGNIEAARRYLQAWFPR